ncbi:non-ribosomal peptide synthase/polyketide synthase, partial [Pseudomonas sp. ES1]
RFGDNAPRLINMYGITETTVHVTYRPLSLADLELEASSPIGAPIPDLSWYVLDADLNPVAKGCTGELYVGRAGLARGYLNRGDLTATRFIPDLFGNSGERLYRTGDLARYHADGVIEYIGRIDQQVKIRGFRIELGEIEARLLEQPEVASAVVLAHNGPLGTQLVGYVVPKGIVEDGLREVLRARLKETLPDYMVPAHLLQLDALPLTANGKLDRKALPAPDASQAQQAYVAPRSELEQRIAAIWQDVLQVERVGLDDDFFALGGHSLLATQIVSRIRASLGLEVALRHLFEHSVLAAFVNGLGRDAEQPVQPPLGAFDHQGDPVLSYAQERQWFLWQLEPDSAAYHIPAVLRLRGALDEAALEQSFACLLARHASLRTTFFQDGEQTRQRIAAQQPLTLERSELANEQALQAAIDEEVGRRFDLEAGPLLRVRLLRLAADDQVLIITQHHIVSDGWSMQVMVDELIQLYQALSQGQAPALPALPVQYADYAAWQRQWMDAGERERQLSYWVAQLGGEQPVLELPTDAPRPAQQSYRGEQLQLQLDPALSEQLQQLAREQGVTLFMLLLASFQALLHRYSGQGDIRVGIPIANRTRVETERLIGFFVNTQVLKADCDGLQPFAQLLQQTRAAALGAQAHQDLPFEQLVDALQPERSLSHNPLFQVMFNHQNQPRQALGSELAGLRIEPLEAQNHSAQFDLSLDTFETANGLGATLTYATDLFQPASIERLAGHWQNLLRGIVAQPEARLGELPLLGAEEYQAIVGHWGQAPVTCPDERPLHRQFEAQAALRPEAPAVLSAEAQISYGELNRQANQLARHLRALGVGPDVLVGIAVERGLSMVVAVLAVLKAGGGYVPLDPEYPKDRLQCMIEDSAIGLLLTQQPLLQRLPIPAGVLALCLDQQQAWQGLEQGNLDGEANPENLAYVMFTSGSTGRPKGVGISQLALVRHAHVARDFFALQADDRALQFSTFNFDAFVEQLYPALICGASVLLRGTEIWDSETFYREVTGKGVTVCDLPTAYWHLLAREFAAAGPRDYGRLRRVHCGGEAMAAEGVQAWRDAGLAQVKLLNTYGPTETTVSATTLDCTGYVDGSQPMPLTVPIGRPLPGRSVHVLDASGAPTPVGVIGELMIGAQMLARGYFNRPGLTAERFMPDPFCSQGGRLYRTGDLARWREGGVLEYVGRIDHQVKIRGFRIELGEIEARLQELPGVRDAIVLARPASSGLQLVGYVVPEQLPGADAQAQLRDELRAGLKQHLPEYMVPAWLLFLERFPVGPNGKLDRKALPAPDASQQQAGYVAPRSDLEQRLAALWQAVLKLERVGLTDNFFELGGDSIVSIQLVARARQAGIHFSARQLFQHQTVQSLASVASLGDAGPQIDQRPATGALALLPIQQEFFASAIAEHHHWNQSVLLKSSRRLDPAVLEAALQALVAHHDGLRTSFSESADGWAAQYRDAQPQTLLWQHKMADEAALLPLAEQAQRSLDLNEGPLLRALLAELDDGSQRLLLVVHHLVVDGVSWRILFDDLQLACQQLGQGQAVQLPPRSSSLQAWGERLQAHAHSEQLQAQLGYWQAQSQGIQTDLPTADTQASLRNDQGHTLYSRLDKDLTRQLLQQAPAAYRTQINDLLLTALARVLRDWTGADDSLVQLEGHGREELFDGLDLTRTVGWFTSVFPLRLSAHADLATSIKTVKEQLRGVPDKGIGYGLLRHLGPPEARAALAGLAPARITFNYLGQFDASFADAQALFQPCDGPRGDEQSPAAPLDNWLSLNGRVYDGELSLGWTFSTQMFDSATIEHLADAFSRELAAVVAHCCSQGAGGLTPSDVALAGLDQAQLDRLPSQGVEDILPLSPMQQGMLFHTLLEADGGDYINQMCLDVSGIDPERFRQACQATLDAHDSLRTSYLWQGDLAQQLQVVHRHAPLPYECLALGAAEVDAASLAQRAEAERRRGFDLGCAPLMRLQFVQTAADRYHLIYTSHHILMDGWSQSQFFGEVLQRYAGEVPAGSPGRLRDYIGWLQGRDADATRAFWDGQLAGLDNPTRLVDALPTPRQAEATRQYREHQQALAPALNRQLGEAARQRKVTLNTLVQAAWLLVLQRYTGQAGVAFGATVAGRPADLPQVEAQIGLFINTLPVIAQPRVEQTVAQWLQQVQSLNLALREHEHTPLFDIQRWAGQGGDGLFDSILVFENYPVAEALQQAAPDGLVFGAGQHHEQTNYPLTLSVGLGDALTLHYSYDTRHFSAASIGRLAGHLCQALAFLAGEGEQVLGDLDLLDAAERVQVRDTWAHAHLTYRDERPVHQLFEAQVARQPQALALLSGDAQLSYAELNAQANRLARHLRSLGVGPDVLVGIAVERGLSMIVGLLAVLKAGGGYVPLDPEYPRDRLLCMIEDSGTQLLLTQQPLLARLPIPEGVQALCLDQGEAWAALDAGDLGVAVGEHNLAYVMFTSGSTGRPKGVGISQLALTRHAWVSEAFFGLRGDDCVLQFSTFNFDGFVEQLYPALICGASVVLRGTEIWDSETFYRELISKQISVVDLTTAYWHMLARDFAEAGPRNYGRLRQVHGGGEAMPPEGLLAWRDAGLGHVRLLNTYGPTEATVTVTSLDCTGYVDGSEAIPLTLPIGRVLPGRSIYLLDDSGAPTPVGVVGELVIGGELLARGYFNRRGLTAERFIPDPFAGNGGRLYRTGDLARYRDDGVIEYVGRIDHQVKIRGFRIELGEIEARLLEQEGVRDAIVLAQPSGNGLQLVGYVVPAQALDEAGQASLREGLRQQLKANLPDYMVPSWLLFLERLPLSPNGKVDRKALPALDGSQLQAAHVAPRTALEQQVAAIWQQVLGVAQVGLGDNFFDLGGHSLLATQAVARIRHQLDLDVSLRSLFDSADLAAFVATLGAPALAQPPMVAVSRAQPLALSYAQQRQWFLWQLDPHSAAYHLPTALRLHGALDVAALQRALDALVQRHESLRTRFVEQDGQAWQVIDAAAVLPIEHESLLDAADEREARLKASVLAAIQQPFDLRSGPLVRVKLIELAAQEQVLLLTLHHIVTDGWSMQVLVDELIALYRADRLGQAAELGDNALQYADYAQWQRQWMEAGEQARQLAYWVEQLGDEQPVLELPTDRLRPAEQSHRGALLDLALEPALAAELAALARREGVTLFMLLLASFQSLLHRYSGQDDIRVGVPVANRGRLETERLVGLFVNTQVLKARFAPDLAFSTLLGQVRQTVLQAQAHQDLPFEQLVEALQPERSLSHSPLFQVLFNHQGELPVARTLQALDGLRVEGLEWDSRTAPFDLSLDTFETGEGGLAAVFTYATDLFDAATIERLARHWTALLQALVAAPQQALADLPMLDNAERALLLDTWNAPQPAASGEKVHETIAAWAQRTPQAIALVQDQQHMSFAELDARANRLAHALVAAGVGPETLVGIALGRTLELPVALLAVLKAGGAYVPLDPDYPEERLAYLMADSGMALLLTDSALREALPIPAGLAVLALDSLALAQYPQQAPQVQVQAGNLAYVIYTSGSTGQPKGVTVAHGPLAMHCQAIGARYEMSPADCELLFMSFAFDGAHERWLTVLSHGGRVLLRDDRLWTPEQTYQALHRHGVTVAAFPPAYLLQLAEHAQRDGNPPPVRVYCFGGDAVPQASYDLARAALKPRYIINGYGPTETVVTPLIWKAAVGQPCGAAYAPIGTRVGQRSAYVLDAGLNLLPPGVAGELYLGGEGVARGYLRRPGLTAERFVPDPYGEPGARVYRSGDRVSQRADGVVDYLGRVDHQVKIRGFRIELGEVEARLQALPGVREALVLAQGEAGALQLVGYVLPHVLPADPQAAQALHEGLRAALRQSLPGYMVPSQLMLLERLPLTPNGKIDRRALPKPDASALQYAYVAPVSELEQTLARIWQAVLPVEQVGLTDNFFEIGGHSLLATQVTSRVQLELGSQVPLELVFRTESLQDYAREVAACVNTSLDEDLSDMFDFLTELEDN